MEKRSGMQTGRCPHCGHEEVYTAHLPRSTDGNGLVIRNQPFPPRVGVYHYVCGHCGYLESYVRRGDLEEIVQNWGKVVPTE